MDYKFQRSLYVIYNTNTRDPWKQSDLKIRSCIDMAGLFDKQAETYLQARPTYPSEWYSMLAACTSQNSLAWDVGTGNGQAALDVAKHYEQVIATDVSEAQLSFAMPHPRVRYVHTPQSMSEDEMVALMGGENRVDLITVATAVHWFDLPKFYKLAKRLLRKPGGLLAVWAYNDIVVNPEFDTVRKRLLEKYSRFWPADAKYIFEGYRNLPFPFESVGLGSEGEPLQLDIPKELSFEGCLMFFKSSSAFASAKEQGVDLLSEEVIKELESSWGGPNKIRTVTYKAFMLAGTVTE
ncbi:putative methyltransferase DDB_G0268948 isoform X1 [Eucalyptus grandis]|uniref:putative methyltransferase DDB_G0268948 isoform X1 n=1 Tax=Eucalyptus grandis TaxID=71139 RepID=UPI0008A0D206|nr:putative methyltransferase DDB_G0268948 isoform X1 [Eucalyptus grandis]